MDMSEKAKNLTKHEPIPLSEKELGKKRWLELQEEEKKQVRGKFIYNECPGGIMELSFKKFKGEPIKKYSLKDGEVYTIPLSVARHLNNNCCFPSYTFKNDEQGRPQTTVSEKVHRTAFQGLEFY